MLHTHIPVSAAAKLLGMTVQNVYIMINDGRIMGTLRPAPKKILIPRSEIERLLGTDSVVQACRLAEFELDAAIDAAVSALDVHAVAALREVISELRVVCARDDAKIPLWVESLERLPYAGVRSAVKLLSEVVCPH